MGNAQCQNYIIHAEAVHNIVATLHSPDLTCTFMSPAEAVTHDGAGKASCPQRMVYRFMITSLGFLSMILLQNRYLYLVLGFV